MPLESNRSIFTLELGTAVGKHSVIADNVERGRGGTEGSINVVN